MHQNPKISVLMSAFNEQDFIKSSIDSILNQTFTNFEFIIINDNSTDNTEQIINSYSDDRIILINNEKNQGLTFSLNKGLYIAKGEYIARFDANDIALPNRLERQIDFLQENPNIAGCGANYIAFDEYGNERLIQYETNPEIIKVKLLFSSQICHAAAMIRKDILLELRYDESFKVAQDFDLWVRVTRKYSLGNIPEVLQKIRIQEQSISGLKSGKQKESAQKVISKQLTDLSIEATPQFIEIHTELSYYEWKRSLSFIKSAKNNLELLIQANKEKKIYHQESFNKFFSDYWFQLCYNSTIEGPKVLKMYYSSTFYAPLSLLVYMKFLIKCILKV